MPSTSNHDSKDVTLAVIKSQLDTIQDTLQTVASIMERLADRVRNTETEIAIIKSQEHDRRIKTLEENAMPVVKSARYLAGVVIALIVALLWSIFTGKTIILP